MIHALDKQEMIRPGFDPSEILQNLPDHRNLLPRGNIGGLEIEIIRGGAPRRQL